MFRRSGNMKSEEVFTRTLFGLILIGSSFFSWGKWVMLVLGIMFLLSAFSGICLTCILYKKFFEKNQNLSQ